MNQNQPAPLLLVRLRRRRRERGAAVFVVVMVITLLLGIGVLAARSASLGTAASGNERQMTQTHYLADYAVMLAAAQLSPDSTGSPNSPNSPLSIITTASSKKFGDFGKCMAQTNVAVPAASLTLPTCYRVTIDIVEQQLAAGGDHVLSPYSLGSPTIEGYFWVELTDMSVPAEPLPGNPANPAPGSLQIYNVTATAFAQVRTKNTGGASLDASAAGSQSTELTRAFLRVGPM